MHVGHIGQLREHWFAGVILLALAGLTTFAASFAFGDRLSDALEFLGIALLLYGAFIGASRMPESWVGAWFAKRLDAWVESHGAGFYGLDLSTETWSTLPEPPVPTFHRLASDGHFVFLFGTDRQIYRFDPGASSWAFYREGPAPHLPGGLATDTFVWTPYGLVATFATRWPPVVALEHHVSQIRGDQAWKNSNFPPS